MLPVGLVPFPVKFLVGKWWLSGKKRMRIDCPTPYLDDIVDDDDDDESSDKIVRLFH